MLASAKTGAIANTIQMSRTPQQLITSVMSGDVVIMYCIYNTFAGCCVVLCCVVLCRVWRYRSGIHQCFKDSDHKLWQPNWTSAFQWSVVHVPDGICCFESCLIIQEQGFLPCNIASTFCVVCTSLCSGAAGEVCEEHVLIAVWRALPKVHDKLWSDAKTTVAAVISLCWLVLFVRD